MVAGNSNARLGEGRSDRWAFGFLTGPPARVFSTLGRVGGVALGVADAEVTNHRLN